MKQGKALPVQDREFRARIAWALLRNHKWPSVAAAVEAIAQKLGVQKATVRDDLARAADLFRRRWRERMAEISAMARSTDDPDRRAALRLMEDACAELVADPGAHGQANHHHHHDQASPSASREC